MINVTDLDFKNLTRTRKVNGEYTITLDVLPTPKNKNIFDLVVEEATVNVLDDDYVIKKLSEKSIGKTYWKQSNAIHKFYVDLINKQQPQVHNGSITFNNYMNLVFENTGYTFVAIDQFSAKSFDNLGNDNRLALLQKGVDRFKAEFELIGNEVHFKKQIGNDADFQFRYGHNIKSINRDIDTTNLATRIRGKGADGIEAVYTSPNADIFGLIDAPPVEDDRFTTKSALLDEMKDRLQDEPQVSLTIDFIDLRAAGYPFTVPNEGDRVFLIYEPMNGLLIETRIMEINETFDVNLKPIKTTVTLSNYTKSFAKAVFDNTQKQLASIINDDGVIKYNVLDEAVKIATEALQSAQTELEFNNGIIAREKDDPNRLVVLNSAGLGVSSDGGNTFRTAITGDGIVADVITAGTLRGIDIIGTNIISFNTQTNDTVTLSDGEITTFSGGKQRFGIYGNGLVAYHWVTENEIATFRASHKNNEQFGADIGAYGDYFSIGYHISGSTVRSQFELNWYKDFDEVFLYGGIGERDSRLDLAASSGGDVPRLRLNNRLIDDTTWGNAMFRVGLDNKKPSDSNFRSGFEIWQYKGTGDGDTSRLLQIDTDSNEISYINAFVDELWVEGLIKTPGFIRSSSGFRAMDSGATGISNGFRLETSDADSAHAIVGHNTGNELVIYPQRYANRDRFRIRSHHRKSDYVDDFVIDNNGDITINRHLHINESVTAQGMYFSHNNPSQTRFWMEYNGTNRNLEIASKDSSGQWRRRIEVEGRGVSGAGNNVTHILDRIRSVGTRDNIVTWAGRVAMGEDTGLMGFVSSSRRYKLMIKGVEDVGVDPYKIHELNVMSWYDRFNTENYAELLTRQANGELINFDVEKLRRIPGLIAEDVHDAGLTLFVNYNKDGKVEGIDDTRLWMLLIPISRDHENRLNEYDDRFGTIENRLKKLENEMNKLKGVA